MLDGSKRTLVSHVGDGSIIKRFDMTPVPRQPEDIVCPHFLELKWAYGCPFSCAWCYLQGTLRMLPGKTKPVFKSHDRIQSHVEAFLQAESPPEILNTGEIADSLMGEALNPPFSDWILSLFRKQFRHKVLFLSKGVNVKNFLNSPFRNLMGNCVILSWSLNAAPVAGRWEKGAPRVQDRIEAARLVSEAGYEVRIRIDPIVPGYLSHYWDLIEWIFDAFTPERITVGSLRGLQSTINAARDKSWVRYLTEPSGWGKRVDFRTRLKMYRGIIEYLRSSYGFDRIALCKESVATWNELGLDWMRPLCNCVW